MGNSVSRSISVTKETTLSLKLGDRSSNSISGGIGKKDPNTPGSAVTITPIHIATPMSPMSPISTISPISPITPISVVPPPPIPPQTPLELYLSYSLPSTPIPSEKAVSSKSDKTDNNQDDDIKNEEAGFPSIPTVCKSQSISTMKTNNNNNNGNGNDTKKRFFFRKKKRQQHIESNIKQQEKDKKKGNGITGVYISRTRAQNLCIFWLCNIEKLREIEKLEIAVLIYFIMIESLKDNDFKSIYKGKKIKQTALSFLQMIKWLILSLNDDDIDLHLELIKLGKMHKYFGVKKCQFFTTYLSALHLTLSEYFPNQYKIEIKYCLDEIFTICSRIMVGKPPIPKHKKHIIDEELPKQITPTIITPSSSFIGISGLIKFQESRSMKKRNIWLKDLNSCLLDDIGKEYFFRYLEQTACYEIVIFLKLYWEFKRCMSEKEKFMVSRKILKICIDVDNASRSNSMLQNVPINISYEAKMNFIKNMQCLENKWKIECKSPKYGGGGTENVDNQSSLTEKSNNFKVESNLLDQMLFETKKLMLNNHWRKFSLQIQLMGISPSQSVSSDDY